MLHEKFLHSLGEWLHITLKQELDSTFQVFTISSLAKLLVPSIPLCMKSDALVLMT
jgi:hypothetical protein